jgi:hypothetical protein
VACGSASTSSARSCHPRLVLLDSHSRAGRSIGWTVTARLRQLAAAAIVLVATHDLDLADGLARAWR